MNITTILPSILAAILATIAYFLFTDGLRKFRYLAHYAQGSHRVHIFHYTGLSGAVPRRGLWKIAVQSNDHKPFRMLLCVPFEYLWFRSGLTPFGCVESNQEGLAVVEVYLGWRPVEFHLLMADDMPPNIRIEYGITCAHTTATASYWHWFQRLGIFG